MGDIWTSSSADLGWEQGELGGAGSARQVTVSERVHALQAEALKGLDAGKSCIRYRRPE